MARFSNRNAQFSYVNSKYPWFSYIDKYNNNNKIYLHDHTSTYSVAKAILRARITSKGNYVTLIIICHEDQSKLKYSL